MKITFTSHEAASYYAKAQAALATRAGRRKARSAARLAAFNARKRTMRRATGIEVSMAK